MGLRELFTFRKHIFYRVEEWRIWWKVFQMKSSLKYKIFYWCSLMNLMLFIINTSFSGFKFISCKSKVNWLIKVENYSALKVPILEISVIMQFLFITQQIEICKLLSNYLSINNFTMSINYHKPCNLYTKLNL